MYIKRMDFENRCWYTQSYSDIQTSWSAWHFQAGVKWLKALWKKMQFVAQSRSLLIHLNIQTFKYESDSNYCSIY